MPPSVPFLGEAGSTPCEYVTEGGWLGAQEAHRIFTKPVAEVGWCWKDIVSGFDGKP